MRAGYTDVVGDVKTSKETSFQSSLFVDIAPGQNGMYYALDAAKGRVFVYNNEGFLYYVFGALGTQLGTFGTPSAIEMRGDDVLVLDESRRTLTVFSKTEYGRLISEADNLYNTGKYEESVAAWQKVLKLNSNFELGYAQIGKVRLMEEKYQEAMRDFELGNYRGSSVTLTDGYNKAFTEYRKQQAAFWIAPVVIAVLALYIWHVLSRRRKRKEAGK